MRLWSRLALVFWLLTGLMSAPAMAFAMPGHGDMDRATMSADMPMTASMHHGTMPQPDKDTDTRHKALSCAVHCLNAASGFILPASDRAQPASSGIAPLYLMSSALYGLSIGPTLEPPISTLV